MILLKKHKNKNNIYIEMVLDFVYITLFGVTEWFVLYICGYYDEDWSSGSISENFVQQQHS